MLLSPEVLEVSTIIGQGKTVFYAISPEFDGYICAGEFGVVYKGYLKKEMIDTVAIKTLKGEHMRWLNYKQFSCGDIYFSRDFCNC